MITIKFNPFQIKINEGGRYFTLTFIKNNIIKFKNNRLFRIAIYFGKKLGWFRKEIIY